MKAPDKLYISPLIYETRLYEFPDEDSIEYIRKDAILKWAKKEEDKLDSGLCSDGFRLALTMLKQKLESL